jgi:hypothetical protein
LRDAMARAYRPSACKGLITRVLRGWLFQ